jgi:hypothetical protein
LAVNLLSLIVIFLALVIVGSIAFIAWEITSERYMPHSDRDEPGHSPAPPGGAEMDTDAESGNEVAGRNGERS